jgi:hypothetical protein
MLALAATTLAIVATPAHGAARQWSLACTPARGSLPHAAAACSRLARLRTPFAPTPLGEACSQVFGGPEVARVSGTFRGRPVQATFTRRNGCEIARWNRLRFLFPIPLGK